MALAAIAGGFGYMFLPSGGSAPVADRLGPQPAVSPAAANLLGQGQDGSYGTLPAPIVTATAKSPSAAHEPGSKHAPHPVTSGPGNAGGVLDGAGLGLYDGNSSPSGIETAASWLGSTGDIRYAEDFVDATDWSHIENPWQLSNWKGSPFTMIWGVPMLPCGSPSTQCSTNVSDYDLVASGGANGYFKTLAQNLVGSGFGSSYIRIGWEFNASWMGWAVCRQDGSGLASWASDFVPAFRNIVTSMRGVSGANFKFIWNPIDSSNSTCTGDSLENFYPGDNYVDDVSLDAYDGVGSSTSDSDRWTDISNGVNGGGWTAETPSSIGGQSFAGYGLNWLAAFGKAHGKEVGLPEWGLNDSNTNAGGGDDTYFMTQMAAWIKNTASGPAIFWNYGGGTLPLNIPNYTSGDTSAATAVFRSAFSTGV